MKKALILILCLLAPACQKTVEVESAKNGNSQGGSSASNQSQAVSSNTSATTSTDTGLSATTEPITFKLTPPKGQKSSYDSKMELKMDAESPAPGEPPLSVVANMTMGMDNEVIASNPDGAWTLKSKMSGVKFDVKMNGNPMPLPPQARSIEGKTYTTSYDRNGKVVRVSGMEGSPAEANIKQMMEQINPTDMLPPRPVRIGESWPINRDMPLPMPSGATGQSMKLKGTGRLSDVNNGRAKIDYDLAIELSGGQVNGNGTGVTVVVYDVKEARLVSNKADMKFNLSIQGPGGARSQPVKATMNLNMQMDLVK